MSSALMLAMPGRNWLLLKDGDLIKHLNNKRTAMMRNKLNEAVWPFFKLSAMTFGMAIWCKRSH